MGDVAPVNRMVCVACVTNVANMTNVSAVALLPGWAPRDGPFRANVLGADGMGRAVDGGDRASGHKPDVDGKGVVSQMGYAIVQPGT
ncbi:MAG: hypothetical protein P8R45_10620, partial [Candidatus Binatia bacterium]|nr:hypothetical protein [Candidatus Binatia bacterium]